MEKVEVDISKEGKATEKVVTGPTLRDVIEQTTGDPKKAVVIKETQSLIDKSEEIDASPNEVAETLLLEVLEERLKTFGKDCWQISDDLETLGTFYMSKRNNLEDAKLCFEKEMSISEKFKDEARQSDTAKNLDFLYSEQARRLLNAGGVANEEQAERILDKNLSLLMSKHLSNATTTEAALKLAHAYLQADKWDQALQTFSLIVTKLHSKDDQADPGIYREYIDLLIGDKKLEMADKLAKQQLKYYRALHSDDTANISLFQNRVDQIQALRIPPQTGMEGMVNGIHIAPDNRAGKHVPHFNVPAPHGDNKDAHPSKHESKDALRPAALKLHVKDKPEALEKKSN